MIPACCMIADMANPVIAPMNVLMMERFQAGTGTHFRQPLGLRLETCILAFNLASSPLAAMFQLASALTPAAAATPVAAIAAVPANPETFRLNGMEQSSTGPLKSLPLTR